jgi:hypothetical protein
MGRMNCKNKFAVSIAGILLLSGAAIADELVQLGPVGGRASVSYIKRDAPKKSVAVNGERRGGAGSTRSDQPHGKLVAHTQSVNNGVTVTYYTESR